MSDRVPLIAFSSRIHACIAPCRIQRVSAARVQRPASSTERLATYDQRNLPHPPRAIGCFRWPAQVEGPRQVHCGTMPASVPAATTIDRQHKKARGARAAAGLTNSPKLFFVPRWPSPRREDPNHRVTVKRHVLHADGVARLASNPIAASASCLGSC